MEVRVRCDPVGGPFERNVTLTQDDGFILGQVGVPAPECDGSWHTVSTVVASFDGAFHSGRAFASAYVSRLDPDTQDVFVGQDTRTIRVR